MSSDAFRFTVRLPEGVRGQARPRVNKRGVIYKPGNDRRYEAAIREAYVNARGPHFGEQPLEILVVSFRKLPKSAPKREAWREDVVKPDASNILKSVEDALNGLAYKDDSQLVKVQCVKAPRRRIMTEHLDVWIRPYTSREWVSEMEED